MSKFLYMLFVLIATSTLSSCSIKHYASILSTEKNVPIKELKRVKKSVVLLGVRIFNERCNYIQFTLGEKQSDGTFKENWPVAIRYASLKGGIRQFQIAPGTYHILQVSCVWGNRTRSFSFPMSDDFLFRKFTKSFSQFTVKSGEVVNVGVLTVNPVSKDKAQIYISNISPYVISQIRKERPLIYVDLRTRLMRRSK